MIGRLKILFANLGTRKRVLFVFLLVLIFSGFAVNQYRIRSNIFTGPFQLKTFEKCGVVNKHLGPPSRAEMKGFINRLDSSGHHIVSAVNILCLSKIYNEDEIKYWTIRQDPLAILVSLARRFRDMKSVCANFDEVTKELRVAQAARQYIPASNQNILRAPEAYILEGVFLSQCKGNFGHLYGAALLAHNVDSEFFFLPE